MQLSSWRIDKCVNIKKNWEPMAQPGPRVWRHRRRYVVEIEAADHTASHLLLSQQDTFLETGTTGEKKRTGRSSERSYAGVWCCRAGCGAMMACLGKGWRHACMRCKNTPWKSNPVPSPSKNTSSAVKLLPRWLPKRNIWIFSRPRRRFSYSEVAFTFPL